MILKEREGSYPECEIVVDEQDTDGHAITLVTPRLCVLSREQ